MKKTPDAQDLLKYVVQLQPFSSQVHKSGEQLVRQSLRVYVQFEIVVGSLDAVIHRHKSVLNNV